MAQLIYAILALLMIMFLSMNMQRNVGRDQQEQSVNEVGTQLTGVGTEVLEFIGSRHFDKYAADSSNVKPYCGRIADDQLHLLSDESVTNANNTHGDCTDYDTCTYIEGFQDKTKTITRGEFDYDVTVVDVEYVDPNDFGTTSATQTFAKKVTIEVENPYLYLGDDPSNAFSLTLERVFTYGCLTESNLIPYVIATDTCPPSPCSRW